MIDCKENEDGSFTISWDENDPLESILNTWTEEDFTKVIIDHANKVIEEHEYIRQQQQQRGAKLGLTD